MAGVDQYTNGIAVTPADGSDLPTAPANGLIATGAGAVAVHFHGQETSVILSMAVGQVLPVKVERVLSTGTEATGIVALY